MFAGQPVGYCANCLQPVSSLQLSPMSFDELDQARKGQTLSLTSASANANASDKNGKKRKPMGGNPTTTVSSSALSPEAAAAAAAEADDGSGTNGNPQGGSSITNTTTATSAVGGGGGGEENGDLRTGRWTSDETEYCDALVQYFEDGKLPIPEGLKLNEFLSNMLKSKQARLTKKMKNAKLATRQYKRKMGYIAAMEEALAFSNLEKQFFCSIKCPVERAEIVFHVQKEWRELFSSYCIAMGQSLDATGWLISIEELDKRMSLQKDAARMVRRKVMLGHALSFDACNSVERGVYIDAMAAASANALLAQQQQQSSVEVSASTSMSNLPAAVAVSQSSLLSEANMSSAAIQTAGAAIHRNELLFELAKNDHNPMKYYSSPFIEKVMKLMDRLNIPFEHVDTWVPSFVSNDKSEPPPAEEQQSEPKCRLCFAGCATADNKIADEGIQNIPLTNDEKFDLLSFGEYSEKFSFDIGCGLPGRVYSSGVASWEQGIQNAPLSQFERSGGASQWGIQTVLGIPIPSPTAGRIVVIFYSTLNRPRNLIMVNRISEALSKVSCYVVNRHSRGELFLICSFIS